LSATSVTLGNFILLSHVKKILAIGALAPVTLTDRQISPKDLFAQGRVRLCVYATEAGVPAQSDSSAERLGATAGVVWFLVRIRVLDFCGQDRPDDASPDDVLRMIAISG
jgi:hypothetical protein